MKKLKTLNVCDGESLFYFLLRTAFESLLNDCLKAGLCRSVINVVSKWDVCDSKLHTFFKALHVVPRKCFSVMAFLCFHIIPSEFVTSFLMSDKHFDDMSWMIS